MSENNLVRGNLKYKALKKRYTSRDIFRQVIAIPVDVEREKEENVLS